MSFDAEAEVKALKAEFDEFKKDSEAHQRLAAKLERHVEDFKNSNSSRRGLPGVSIKGDTGASGRDAVLRVVVDGKENVVHVFGEDGSEKATLVAVQGPAGRDGVSPPPAKDGRNGVDGKSASLSEIVSAVLAELKRRWMN